MKNFGISLKAVSKESACNNSRPGFNSWVRNIPWRRKWQPNLVFLPGEFHGEESPAGYSPWTRKSRTQFNDQTTTKEEFQDIDILGISELKWTRMGEFNSDDNYMFYCGQESLEEIEQPSQSTRVQNAVRGCNLKNDRMISVHFQGKPFNITVTQIYGPTTNAKEAEVEWFYEDLQDLLEQTPKRKSFSSEGIGMQKQEVKRYLEYQASLALEYKMKQGKG